MVDHPATIIQMNYNSSSQSCHLIIRNPIHAFWDNVLVVCPSYNEIARHRIEPFCKWISTFCAIYTGFHFCRIGKHMHHWKRDGKALSELVFKLDQIVANTAASSGCMMRFVRFLVLVVEESVNLSGKPIKSARIQIYRCINLPVIFWIIIKYDYIKTNVS